MQANLLLCASQRFNDGFFLLEMALLSFYDVVCFRCVLCGFRLVCGWCLNRYGQFSTVMICSAHYVIKGSDVGVCYYGGYTSKRSYIDDLVYNTC